MQDRLSKSVNIDSISICVREQKKQRLSAATQGAFWLRSFLQCLGRKQSPTYTYEDNQVAFKLAKNCKNHSRVNHIDIRNHFVEERVQLKEV